MNISGRVCYALGLASVLGCSAGSNEASTMTEPNAGSARQGLAAIDISKELMITDLSVVNDALRTVAPPAKKPAKDAGVWSFATLMTAMAGAHNPSDFVLHLLQQWQAPFTLNGATCVARPNMQSLVIDPWPKLPDGKLDLARAPVRLLAIAYRPDLRNMSDVGQKQAGEGRFVFGVLGATGNLLQFTIILEYGLPASTPDDVLIAAESVHHLGSIAFGPQFNDALSALTATFSRAGACPEKPNGSCINQVRSNDVSLADPGTDPNNTGTKLWELREFHINASTGTLDQTAVNQTPDISFKGTPALTDYINQNEAEILNGSYRLSSTLLGPSAKTPKFGFLDLGLINNPEARFKFALNTCDGCHSTETGTPFLQIHNRAADAPAQLSGYLTGTTTLDPATGATRTFSELAARAADLQTLLDESAAEVGAEKHRPKPD